MIATARPHRKCLSTRVLHAAFLAMLPDIRRNALIAFRDLDPEAKAEAVQEVTANAFVAFARLAELGKTDVAYPSVLAKYGIAQCRDGRRVGGQLNVNDVLSSYAQRRKCFSVERLDKYDRAQSGWMAIAVEDRHATPADIAAIRLDFAAWLDSLPIRKRRLAETLAVGETTSDVAQLFRISSSRVSQLRRQLKHSWEKFHDKPVSPYAGSREPQAA